MQNLPKSQIVLPRSKGPGRREVDPKNGSVGPGWAGSTDLYAGVT